MESTPLEEGTLQESEQLCPYCHAHFWTAPLYALTPDGLTEVGEMRTCECGEDYRDGDSETIY